MIDLKIGKTIDIATPASLLNLRFKEIIYYFEISKLFGV